MIVVEIVSACYYIYLRCDISKAGALQEIGFRTRLSVARLQVLIYHIVIVDKEQPHLKFLVHDCV